MNPFRLNTLQARNAEPRGGQGLGALSLTNAPLEQREKEKTALPFRTPLAAEQGRCAP
jgi:hypothetical protein